VVIDASPESWDIIIDQFKIKTENRIIVGRTYDNLDTVPDELVAKINNSLVNVVSVSSEYNKQTLIEFGINKPIIVDQCPEVDLWTFGVDSKNEGVSAEAYLNRSIFNQGQDVKILNLPYDKENFFFNPCIFSRNENHYLMARHAKITNDKPLEFNNTLKLYQLDSNFEIKQQIPLTIRDELQNEQYEDPRVIFFKNKYYIGCANYVKDRGGYIQQKVLVFDEHFNHIDNLHINYDGNGSFITSNTNHQKNWTFFVYNGNLMIVYRMNPHVIIEVDLKTNKVITEYRNFQDIIINRGGSIERTYINPVWDWIQHDLGLVGQLLSDQKENVSIDLKWVQQNKRLNINLVLPNKFRFEINVGYFSEKIAVWEVNRDTRIDFINSVELNDNPVNSMFEHVASENFQSNINEQVWLTKKIITLLDSKSL
jgi:hypothetical protein